MTRHTRHHEVIRKNLARQPSELDYEGGRSAWALASVEGDVRGIAGTYPAPPR